MSEIPNEEESLPPDTLALINLLPNFDDEAPQRHEHEMDRIIREFEDEPYVRHDEIPDSDSDEDGAPRRGRKGRRQRRRTHIERGEGRLFFHQTFIRGVSFKENVVDYALQSGRNLYQYKYDKDKTGFKCYGGDPEEEKSWGVVKVENTDNWSWFVNKLKVDLDLKDGDGYILVSDRQKGLIKAVELELPKMEHRMCVRHIYGNMKKKHGDLTAMKPFIWAPAWSYNEPDFIANLDKLKAFDMSVYDDVMKTNPKTWCRAFQKIGNFCEDVENNPTESFNNTIKKAREKPFVPMLEMITTQAMAQIAKRSAISHAHSGICTPYVSKFLAKQYKEAKACKVTRSTNGMYQSQLHGINFRVNLEDRTCSCKKWEVCGIPCQHAYGVILAKKLQPEDYVCHWFRTALWRRNYTDGIVPPRGASFSPQTDASNVHDPPNPNKAICGPSQPIVLTQTSQGPTMTQDSQAYELSFRSCGYGMEKAGEYHSKDFEWEFLKNLVENDPCLSHHIHTHEQEEDEDGPDSQAWQDFHARHSSGKFFKERRYLLKEFPELLSCGHNSKLLEVGCGNGSTVLPILRGGNNISVYACDCSSEALVRTKENIARAIPTLDNFHSFSCDFSTSQFPNWVACHHCRHHFMLNQHSGKCSSNEHCIGGVDFVTLIFTLSAVPKERMPRALKECFSVLKPGGLLLFRDYGLYDMTMLRFKPERLIGFREYVRSDGTLSYFFCLDTVRRLFTDAGFIEVELEYCCVKAVNRRKGKEMYRVWVHGKFQKPF
ncbi:hypothetical protein AALP_AA4G014500 [Arabis alpina]|uniref:SWIM-type domain-containing protein n=1 Tax=Arabis alpina TaxID=50452 RepID=A0A087H0G5_ARAAL|nr:hypothetical protein AALP_AA4G014500 [Arabis alpina]